MKIYLTGILSVFVFCAFSQSPDRESNRVDSATMAEYMKLPLSAIFGYTFSDSLSQKIKATYFTNLDKIPSQDEPGEDGYIHPYDLEVDFLKFAVSEGLDKIPLIHKLSYDKDKLPKDLSFAKEFANPRDKLEFKSFLKKLVIQAIAQ